MDPLTIPAKNALMGSVFLGLAACGSGSSERGGTDGLDAGGGGSLPGRILATDGAATRNRGVIYEIDPASGSVSTFIEPKPEAGDTGRYDNQSTFLVGGALNEDALLLSVRFCDNDNASSRRFCVERVSADGAVDRLYSAPVDIAFPAVMSPDETIIATLISPSFAEGPVTMLLVSPTGAIRASRELSERYDGIAGYDWTPDNRPVYAYRDPDEGVFVIVIGEPNSLMPSEVFIASTDPELDVGRISVSPDGRRIAFDLLPVGASRKNAVAWVYDRDTAESVLVAEDDGSFVRSPEWSPDGRFLLVTHGESAVGDVLVESALPYMMVVEWQGETVVLNPSEGIGRTLTINNDGAIPEITPGLREQWILGEAFWVR